MSSPAIFNAEVPDFADRFSNRCGVIIHLMGAYKAWDTLTIAARAHVVSILLCCLIAEILRVKFPQQYRARRNVVAAFLVVLAQGGPGGWGIYLYLMKAPIRPIVASIVSGSMYILGSFFFFTRPWQLPLVPHLVTSIIVLPALFHYNAGICDTPLMTTPEAHRVTGRVFKMLSYLHSMLAPSADADTELSVRSKCVAVSNTSVMIIGFLAPTIILATREANMYRQFKRRNSRTSLPSWRNKLYCTLGSADCGDRMRMLFITLVLVHITWTFHISTLNASN